MSHAAMTVPLEQVALPRASAWARLHVIGGVVALLGALTSLSMAARSPQQFYFSWLVGFVFVHSLAVGCLYFVLIHHATQAAWGIVVRRLAENAAATLPLLALLFVPILFGLPHLYPWARPELVAADKVLRWKQPFLNTQFF